MTLNDPERHFAALSSHQYYADSTKWLKTESRSFRSKVALYLNFSQNKFYDEIRMGPTRKEGQLTVRWWQTTFYDMF